MYNISSEIKNHRLYSDYKKVKSRLSRHNFVCWIAGGAVRDFCLGREVNEFDLVTDATTEVLKALFPEAVLVGESYGVLKIPITNGEFFDLTTFRQESDYKDGRRPSHVESSTPYKDCERRDFRINAMFWDDVQESIIDYVGGVSDLQFKKLECVGDPNVRFAEDYLRLIRLARFSAVLGFQIESTTESAAITHIKSINKISGERLWSELVKISKVGAWQKALQLPVFKLLIEEIFEEKFEASSDVFSRSAELMMCVYGLNPARDFSDLLKKKFKISNKDLAEYQLIRKAIEFSKKSEIVELAFDIEKDEKLKARLLSLIEMKIIQPKTVIAAIDMIANCPEPLIEASDLVKLIPNTQISSELRNIRMGQFSKTYKTKADVLDHLKKKYAN